MLHSATENIDTHKRQQQRHLSFSPSRFWAIAIHGSFINRAISVVFSMPRLIKRSLTAAFWRVIDLSVGSRDDSLLFLSLWSRSTTTYWTQDKKNVSHHTYRKLAMDACIWDLLITMRNSSKQRERPWDTCMLNCSVQCGGLDDRVSRINFINDRKLTSGR